MIQLIQTVKIETGRLKTVGRGRGRFSSERNQQPQTVTISGTLQQMKNLLNCLHTIASACPLELAAIGLASGVCPNTGAKVSSKAPIQINGGLVRDLESVIGQLERCQ